MDLSVICPVYNNAETMLPMIASFQQQNLGDYTAEYVFICNSCTDNSEEMLFKLMGLYPDTFKHYKIIHENYADVGHARQDGINASTGRYIMFCDMDDWLLSNTTFKDLIAVADAYPNHIVKFNFDLPKKDYFYVRDNNVYFATYWKLKNTLTCTLWRYLFPRDVFNKIQFHYGLNGEDDLDIMKQIETLFSNKEVHLATIQNTYYFWNYLEPHSYSYSQMQKEQLISKEEFLELIKTIPEEEKTETLIKSVENLL